nr:reverse transcriptase domain-containing protein [Tanacetum cinerariifolium]
PKNEKSSIYEPPVVELKDLPPHLEYAFLEGDGKLPVIIAKDLKDEEKTALIKGINLEFYTHKILMEDDFKPSVQHQRRVNPKIHEVIKKKVFKLLDAGLIYPILDSHSVSLVHYVPKKGNEYYCFLDDFSVGNKMHKAFPLLEESFHWQYKFPLPVEGVPTASRMEIPLPGVCTAMIKKLPVKDIWHLH